MRIHRTLGALGLLLSVLVSVVAAQDVRTLQQNASAGNGTILTVTGLSAVGLQIAGVAAGADRVVNWEASENTTTYSAVMCQNVATLALATTATVDGTTSQVWRCPVAGMTRFRARLSGGTTGTVNVTATGTSVSSGGGSSGVVLLAEVDDAPGGAYWKIRVTNDALTDNGDGTATLNIGVPGASGDTSSAESSALDGQLVVFDGTGGKTIEKYNGAAGILKTDADAVVSPAIAADVLALAGNAAADGATKGVVTFAAADFNCTTGVCSLDYANTQKASAAQPGALSAADWTAFDAKGDMAGPGVSIDNELPLFDGTGGATLKRFTGTGMVAATSGVVSIAVADTDYQQPLTAGAGLAYSAGTLTTALQESGALFDGTGATLTCGEGTGGQFQIGPDNNLEYCGYEVEPLLHIAGTPGGLTWGDTDSCAGDENQGKLTVISGVIQCGPDVSDASTVAWNDGGATSLTCGGGAQGQHQVMNTGRVEYCGGEDVSVLYAGYLLPTPLSFNITAATCTGDAGGGKLTVNGSNQVVCASDVVGEGGGGPGDVTAFGSCATGDCATTGSPLTSYWMAGSAAPAPPAATQGRVFFDQTAKNLAVIADDSAIKYGAQVIAGTEHFYLTSFAADGSFGAARPSTATLSDGSTLVKLTDAQVLTNKHVVDRPCTLSASSGAVAVNADGCNIFVRHDVGGTLDIANPTATAPNPRDYQVITFDLLAAAAQTVTWGNLYDDSYGLALPTTIPAGRRIAISYRYNPNSAKYELWSAHDPIAIVSAVLYHGSTDGVITTQPQASAGTYNWNWPITAGTTGEVLTSAGGVASPMTWTPVASANTASAIVARDGSGNFTAGTITAALTGNASTATSLQADLPYSGLTPATAASKLLARGDGGAGDWQEVSLGTNLSMSGTTLNATGGGGGTGTIQLPVFGVTLPATLAALVDRAENNSRLLFDATTSWCAWWEFVLPADYTGSPVFIAQYSMTSATTGSFNQDIAVLAVTPGDAVDANLDANYDTVNACDDATVPGTAGHMKAVSCALTNFDSAAAGDLMRLKTCRDVGDTATGNAEVLRARLEYAK